MLIVHVFETIAVFLFIMLIVGLFGGSLDNQSGLIQLIGLFVLLAWLAKKLIKVAHKADPIMGFSLLPLLEAPIANSGRYRRIELHDLCSGHRLSLLIAFGVFIAVSVSTALIYAICSLIEGSPVTSTVWTWTYRIAIPIAGTSLVLTMGTIFHARCTCAQELQPKPFRCAKKEGQCFCKQEG